MNVYETCRPQRQYDLLKHKFKRNTRKNSNSVADHLPCGRVDYEMIANVFNQVCDAMSFSHNRSNE